MIKIEVHATKAVIRSQEPLTVGLKGAKARFSFGEPWDNLIKTAVFCQGEKAVTVANIGAEVTIPWEVLTQPGLPVQIGVYGTDSTDSVAIPTLWAETHPVHPGADPDADPSAEATPALWEQLQGQIGSLDQLNSSDQSNLVAAVNEANRAVYLVSITGNDDGSYQADKSIRELLQAHDCGKMLMCTFGGLYFSLTDRYNGPTFEFTTIKSNTKCCITISADGTVRYATTVLASSLSKLPNPEKLTFIGAATAKYDGSEEVIVGIPTKVSQLVNDSGFLTAAPVTGVNGQTGDVTLPTPIIFGVTEQADGSFQSDLSCAELLELHNAGNALYCRYGNRVLPLTVASKPFCSFCCIYGGTIYTVQVGSASVTVSTAPMASGSGTDGITPHIGTNGNWFIGETDTGMPSRGEDAPQEAVLYTPQDLTEEQKAQVRENIGIDDLPTGGGFNDNPFELINSITLENDSGLVNFTTDSNGEAFELEDFLLVIRAKTTSEGTSFANGKININGKLYTNPYVGHKADHDMSSNSYVYFMGVGSFCMNATRTSSSAFGTPTILTSAISLPIKSIALSLNSSSLVYLTGGTFELYGRRVKK